MYICIYQKIAQRKPIQEKLLFLHTFLISKHNFLLPVVKFVKKVNIAIPQPQPPSRNPHRWCTQYVGSPDGTGVSCVAYRHAQGDLNTQHYTVLMNNGEDLRVSWSSFYLMFIQLNLQCSSLRNLIFANFNFT